jgi:hypothetical protein
MPDGIRETRIKIKADTRQVITDLLFDIHCLAMDAHAEPTQVNIRKMQDKIRELSPKLADYYYSLAWNLE